MRHYEVVFLVHPDQSEQVGAMVDKKLTNHALTLEQQLAEETARGSDLREKLDEVQRQVRAVQCSACWRFRAAA